jgi:YVTN family beta-propeller protein
VAGREGWGTTPAYDPNTSLFYEPVSNVTENATATYYAGYLAAISPATDRLVHLFPVGLEPEGVTYDSSNGLLYVLNYDSNNVSVVDPSTNATIGSLAYPSGNALDGSMAVDNSSGVLFLASAFGLYDLNVTNDAFAYVAGSSQAQTLSVVYDNQTGEVYEVGTEVMVIGPINDTVWKTIALPAIPSSPPGALTIDWSTDELYVPWDNNTTAVELATNTLGPTLTLSSGEGVAPAATFDPDNGMIYVVTDYPNYNVTELNPATHRWVASSPALPTGEYGGIAYSAGSGRFLLAGVVQSGSSGFVLMTPTLQVVGQPMSATYPAGDYFDPTTGYLFVLESGLGLYGNASVVDPATGKILGYVAAGLSPHAVWVDPSTGYGYIANFGPPPAGHVDNLTVFNARTFATTGSIPVGVNPFSLTYDPDTGYLYVVNSASANITILDPTTNSSVGSIALPGITPGPTVFDPSTTYLYVLGSVSGETYGELDTVNPSSDSIVGETQTYFQAFAEAFDAATGLIYVQDTNSSIYVIQEFDPASGSFVGSINLYHTTLNMAWDPVNGLLYIPDQVNSTNGGYDANTVTEVNVTSGTLVNLTVAERPNGIAVDASTGEAFVANFDSGSVMFIDPGTPAPSSYTITFQSVPTSCSITFNGVTYTNGQQVSGVAAGTYPLVAPACTGETFSSWSSTVGSVGSTTSNTTTVTVSATGTITATFTATSVTYVITLQTSPTTCSITFDGATYTNGQQASGVAAGTYSLVAPACTGETFSSWSSTAGSVASTTSASTTVTVSATGTITGTFTATPPPTYVVTFQTSPTTCSITFNGVAYTNGQQASGVAAGTYPLVAPACTGETFTSWSSTAGTVSSPSSASTTVSISATGTVTATFTATPPPTSYPVTFTETGLPTGTSWSVTFNSALNTSTTVTIGFSVVNGMYSFTVGTVAGYTATPGSGQLTVNGGPASQEITFTVAAPTPSPKSTSSGFLGLPGSEGYDLLGGLAALLVVIVLLAVFRRHKLPVVFTESGLPGGTQWSVALDGSLQAAKEDVIMFTVGSGTHSYRVGGVGSFVPSPAMGTIEVKRDRVDVRIRFDPSRPKN